MMFPAERAARAATLTAGLGMGVDLAKEQGRRSKAASAAEFTTVPRLTQVIAVVDFPVQQPDLPPPWPFPNSTPASVSSSSAPRIRGISARRPARYARWVSTG